MMNSISSGVRSAQSETLVSTCLILLLCLAMCFFEKYCCTVMPIRKAAIAIRILLANGHVLVGSYAVYLVTNDNPFYVLAYDNPFYVVADNFS